jgi:hypothetical protein
MAGDDPANVFTDNWVAALCHQGVIDNLRDFPVEFVGYGMIFDRKRNNLAPQNIQAPFGFHYFDVWLIGSSPEDIDAFLKQCAAISDSATIFTANTTYSRFFIDVDNVQFLHEWKGIPLGVNVRHIALAGLWAVLRIHDAHRIGDPRMNDLGVPR